jgi:putative transposase
MKTNRYTEAQIIAILRHAEGGVPVAEYAVNMGIGGITPAQKLKMAA